MILLDTHVVLWLVVRPEKLGAATSDLCRGERVGFSSISTLEVMIKQMAGRLDVGPDFATRVTAQGLVEVPFTSVHAAAIVGFPELAGTDPFDRALLAQAQVEHCRFVTADRRLLGLDREWILDARA